MIILRGFLSFLIPNFCSSSIFASLLRALFYIYCIFSLASEVAFCTISYRFLLETLLLASELFYIYLMICSYLRLEMVLGFY